MASNTIEIHFEVCQNCEKHSWCTHHDEKKYHALFIEIKAAIEASVPNTVCVKNKSSAPSIGAFEITHLGVIIFSKKNTGLFPCAAPTAERVAIFLDDIKEKRDVTKYASMQEKRYEAPRKQKERPTFESYKKLKEEEDNSKSQQVAHKEVKQQKQSNHTEEEYQEQEPQQEEQQQAYESFDSNSQKIQQPVQESTVRSIPPIEQPVVEQQVVEQPEAEQEKVDTPQEIKAEEKQE